MAMEVESLDLTIEDVLRLRRGYITDLFVEDKKTEVEIVELLYECRLFVTLPQIRICLQDWGLLPASPAARSPSSPPSDQTELEIRSVLTPINTELPFDTHSVSGGWELINPDIKSPSNHRSHISSPSNGPFLPDSPTYTPSPVTAPYTPSSITAEFDSETANLYKERPLPSLPAATKNKRRSSQLSDLPRKDKLKLTCHHGDEFHAVEITLGILPQGPLPIETFASDDQGHERISLGMERTPKLLPTLAHRRAGKWSGKGNNSRTEKLTERWVRDEKNKEDSKSR